jgi:hypothetical protein
LPPPSGITSPGSQFAPTYGTVRGRRLRARRAYRWALATPLRGRMRLAGRGEPSAGRVAVERHPAEQHGASVPVRRLD